MKNNYNYGINLFNKDLEISIEFFGDMKIIDSSLISKKNIQKKIKDIPELKAKKIICYLENTAEPFYETILFFEDLKVFNDTITKTELILFDKQQQRIVYKKSKANKAIYLFLKSSIINHHDYLVDAQKLIKMVKFDNQKLNNTTYQDVFLGVKNSNNYLFARKSLKSNILSQTNEQKWNQYQFLTTINSFISNNVEYDSLISRNTPRYQPTLDSLKQITKFDSKEIVLQKIKNLTQNEKVVMLNEKHWFPNHRFLASQFLEILKENNFNYLAIETLEFSQDSIINKRGFPSINSGYCAREPYFAHFIRKAKSLGFKIVSYDYKIENKDRELSQAYNLKKIIDSDPNAKIFVYAGVDHILESNSTYKWMAEYFKDLTKIDPLTFSQDKVVGQTSEDIVLLSSNLFSNVKRLNTSVDFFIVNNLKPTLEKIYSNNEFKEIILDNKKFKNKNLLLRVFNKEEYKLIGKNAVPIYITSIKCKDSNVKVKLPIGSYFVSIISDINEIFFDDFTTLK